MQRVIIFTEYRATQKWLHDLLEREGLAEPGRLLTLYGGMNTEDREAHQSRVPGRPQGIRGADSAGDGCRLRGH